MHVILILLNNGLSTRVVARNSDMSREVVKVSPLSEMVKVFDLIRKEKKLYPEVARIYGKNKSPMWKL